MKVTRVKYSGKPDGMFFFFDGFEDEMTELFGYSGWNAKTVEVVQRGSQTWTGTVKVWSERRDGRRDEGEGEGQWQAGDTLTAKACAENGSHIETSIRCYYPIYFYLQLLHINSFQTYSIFQSTLALMENKMDMKREWIAVEIAMIVFMKTHPDRFHGSSGLPQPISRQITKSNLRVKILFYRFH